MELTFQGVEEEKKKNSQIRGVPDDDKGWGEKGDGECWGRSEGNCNLG